MSELADRERLVKRGWAAPGGSHDRVVQAMKIGLPALIGVVLAFLAFAPFEDKQEVSFLLDKNKVDQADDRMQVQSAQYRGVDDQGRPFVIVAQDALQRTATDAVQIRGMRARMGLQNGPAELSADHARYDVASDRVAVVGPILMSAADGYRMETRDVVVNLRTRQLASNGAVEGRMPLGTFSGGRLEADLGERRVVLTGRPRLHIVQGAMR